MILTRTPCRISFVGGGTDLPAFFKEHGPGMVISATIDYHIYTTIHKSFEGLWQVHYRNVEATEDSNQIINDRVRATIQYLKIKTPLEIHCISEIPSGLGLGGSSAFLVNLLTALTGKPTMEIAKIATDIEVNLLKEPIGFQDQYATAIGGLNLLMFHDNRVQVIPQHINSSLTKWLLLFYTNIQRSASQILKPISTTPPVSILQDIRNLVPPATLAISQEDYMELGNIIHKYWLIKRQLSPQISNQTIDDIYKSARRKGMIGGKLCGAGGGGTEESYVGQGAAAHFWLLPHQTAINNYANTLQK